MSLSSLPPSTEAQGSSPTHVRYFVIGLATLMAVLLYLDRYALSFMELYIKEDLGLSDREVAWLLSAFFLSYALAQVPSGWLSDRYGSRLMLTLYMLLWSLFTGVMGLANSLYVLILLRLGCGLAQAGAYPTSGSMLSKWAPLSARGMAGGLVSTGGRFGGFIAPVLTAYLLIALVPITTPSRFQASDLLDAAELREQLTNTDESPTGRLSAFIHTTLPAAALDTDDPTALLDGLNDVLKRRDLYSHAELKEFGLAAEAKRLAALPEDQLTEPQVLRRNRLLLEAAYPKELRKVYGLGWRPLSLIYGAAGVVVAGLFWLVVRDRPRAHPACNAAEVALIEAGRTSVAAQGKVGGVPIGAMLRSPGLWYSSISQFGTNLGWVFLLTWFPRYLAEEHKVPLEDRGWMASTPIFLGMLGMFMGGWVTDVMTRRMGLRWGRCLPMALTRFVALAAFLVCMVLKAPWPVTIALSLVAIATDIGTPAIWAYMQDAGGRHVGSILGWGNMWGNIGAFLSPLILAGVKTHFGWNATFLTCAVAFFFSGIAALFIDARVPIVSEET